MTGPSDRDPGLACAFWCLVMLVVWFAAAVIVYALIRRGAL